MGGTHAHAHDHGHHHAHGHHHHDEQDASVGNLTLAFALNFVFTIAEIIGGFWTNSVAILADALHDFGDSMALLLAIIMQRVSRRGRDETFSYGYRRFSLLGALFNGLILVAGAVVIFFEAIPRIFAPEAVHAPGMIGFAVAGILFNGLAVLRLHGAGSLNERMVRWHLLEDVLGWVAVLITATFMLFFDLPVLDPLLSIGINLFVLYNVVRMLYETTKVFLQSVPKSVSVTEIERRISEAAGVTSLHDTHVWSLDGSYNVLTTHVVVSEGAAFEEICEIKNTVRTIARENSINHATIEVERPDEDCGLANC